MPQHQDGVLVLLKPLPGPPLGPELSAVHGRPSVGEKPGYRRNEAVREVQHRSEEVECQRGYPIQWV